MEYGVWGMEYLVWSMEFIAGRFWGVWRMYLVFVAIIQYTISIN